MTASYPKATVGSWDHATLEACRSGDRQALGRVFRAHAKSLERLLGKLVGPSADMEDILQTTYLQAIPAFRRFRGEASVTTWLTRIAVRVAYAHFRRPDQRRMTSLELVEEEPVDPSLTPESQTSRRRQLERLHRHLETLGSKRRIAFILHVLDGKPVDEVAALVGASVTATKSRIFWARRSLFARVRKDPVLAELLTKDEPGADALGDRS